MRQQQQPRLKAIETVYKGYRFRSRLEARWAVFFDVLDVTWEYEKEGYDLDGIWYLPDFWLPGQLCWFEVKHEIPTEEEKEKAVRLAIASGYPVVLLGDIPSEQRIESAGDSGLIEELRVFMPGGEEEEGKWNTCFFCGQMIVQDLRTVSTSCGCVHEALSIWPYAPRIETPMWVFLKGHAWAIVPNRQLRPAYQAARLARFEHGENGGAR